MVLFDFKSDKHFVTSSDETTIRVCELSDPTIHPSYLRTTHWKEVGTIIILDGNDNGDGDHRAKEQYYYDGLLFFDGHGKIEGHEALTKLARHLARSGLMVSPGGCCFQDVTELGEHRDFGARYLRLNDLFSWTSHGVELARITMWPRLELKYAVPRQKKISKQPMAGGGVVASKEKYEELKRMLSKKDEELEKVANEMEDEIQKLKEEKEEELKKLREEMEETIEKKDAELRKVKRQRDEAKRPKPMVPEGVSKEKYEGLLKRMAREKDEELEKLREESEEDLQKLRDEKDGEIRKLKEEMEDASEKHEEELRKSRKEKDEVQKLLTKKNDGVQQTLKRASDDDLQKLRKEKVEEVRKLREEMREEIEKARKEKEQLELEHGRKQSWAHPPTTQQYSYDWAVHKSKRRAVPANTWSAGSIKSVYYCENTMTARFTGFFQGNISVRVVDEDTKDWPAPPRVDIFLTDIAESFDRNNWWFVKISHPDGGDVMLAYYDGDGSYTPGFRGYPTRLPIRSREFVLLTNTVFFMIYLNGEFKFAFMYRD
ncbi:unnamed protein product [Linum trigynum]|uniref:Uncharacterized protein n=1 Tax=Linum trigynum TaxID=586398 RepID=A0AAV2GHC7_9ROSI